MRQKTSALDRAVKQAADRVWKETLSGPSVELRLISNGIKGTALQITLGQKISVGGRIVKKNLRRTFYQHKPTSVPAIYAERFLEDGLLTKWQEETK